MKFTLTIEIPEHFGQEIALENLLTDDGPMCALRGDVSRATEVAVVELMRGDVRRADIEVDLRRYE